MDPISKRFPRAAAFALLLLLLFPLAGCRAPSGTTAGSGERRAAPPSEENVEVLLGERQLLELSDGAYGSFSVALPQNWVGTPERGGNGSSSLSLTVRRRDEPEGGAFRICYSRSFGVCGTGLRTEVTLVAGYPARMGVYDGGAVWDFIVFGDTPPGAYWIDRSFSAAWWEKNREEVLSILSTLEIGEPGILREGEITALAEAEATKKYVRASALFDFDAACWTVRLSDPLSAAGDELFSFDA
ncbi:MAG: hypothetical protein II192_02720, partial [Clostridia bacterium]|nr:hypothetical protein [Clostridia bacterium]